jgi:hypothetical protein
VPCFCSIFNSKRNSKSINILIHRPSLHSIAGMCKVSFSKYTSFFWCMILAKSLIVSKKNSETAVSDRNFTFRLHGSIRYSRAKHAVLFYLRKRTTAHREYLMSSIVSSLVKFWVCKLSCLKRHTHIINWIKRKENNETTRTYCGKLFSATYVIFCDSLIFVGLNGLNIRSYPKLK